MLDEEQAVDVLAIRRNGLWTIKIFTPESQKAKELSNAQTATPN